MDYLMAQLGFVLYHAIRAAPYGKLEAMDFETFIPNWWSESTESAPEDDEEKARQKLRDKFADMFGQIGV